MSLQVHLAESDGDHWGQKVLDGQELWLEFMGFWPLIGLNSLNLTLDPWSLSICSCFGFGNRFIYWCTDHPLSFFTFELFWKMSLIVTHIIVVSYHHLVIDLITIAYLWHTCGISHVSHHDPVNAFSEVGSGRYSRWISTGSQVQVIRKVEHLEVIHVFFKLRFSVFRQIWEILLASCLVGRWRIIDIKQRKMNGDSWDATICWITFIFESVLGHAGMEC